MTFPAIAAGKLGIETFAGARRQFRERPIRSGVTAAIPFLAVAAVYGVFNGAADSASEFISSETVQTAEGGNVEVNKITIDEDIDLAGIETTVTDATGTIEKVLTVIGYEHQASLIESTVDFRTKTEVHYPASEIEIHTFRDSETGDRVKEYFFDWNLLSISTSTVNGSVWSENRTSGTAALRELSSAFSQVIGTQDWQPFGLDISGNEGSNAAFNVTSGAALKAGLRSSDDCVRQSVVPYAQEIFRQGLLLKYGWTVEGDYDEVRISFVNGPDSVVDPADLPPVAISTEFDPTMDALIKEFEIEATAGTGTCELSPLVQRVINDAVRGDSEDELITEAANSQSDIGGRT